VSTATEIRSALERIIFAEAEINADRRIIRQSIARERARRGVTMRELAGACGWNSVAHMSDLESGRRNWTHVAAIKALAFLEKKGGRK